MDISSAGASVANCIGNTFALIRDQVDSSKHDDIVASLVNDCTSIASMLAVASQNHYISNSSVDGVLQERNNQFVSIAQILENCANSLKSTFPGMTNLQATAAKNYIQYLVNWAKVYHPTYRDGKIQAMTQIVRKKDPSYTPPEIKKSGCYVATCVYGSYDCP